MTVVLGIDPGSVSAAWGLLSPEQGYSCGDVPVANGMIDASGFADIIVKSKASLAVIEKVNAFPKQGVSSSFRFGMGTGIIHGVIAALGFQRIEVAPSVWKRHYHLGASKEAARALALKRFPAVAQYLRHKHDVGRAEALLIALWWLEQR